MLLKFLGWFWIATGALFLLKPDKLRNKLKKKSVKKLRRWFFAIALVFGVLLIKATWSIPGVPAKVLMAVGIIALLKAVYFFRAAASEKIIEWFLGQPVKIFRVWAVSQIILGAILLTI